MDKSSVSALARKLEGYRPSSKFESFEAFEQEKRKRKWGFLWAHLGLGTLLIAAITLYMNPKVVTGGQETIPANALSSQKMVHEPAIAIAGADSSASAMDSLVNTGGSASFPAENEDGLRNSTNGEPIAFVEPTSSFPANNSASEQSLDFQYDLKQEAMLGRILENILNWSPSEFELLGDYRGKVEPISEDSTVKNLRGSREEATDSKAPLDPSMSILAGPRMAQNRLGFSADASSYIHPDFQRIFESSVHQDIDLSVQFVYNRPVYKGLSFNIGLGYAANRVNGRYEFSIDSVPVYDIDNTIAGFVRLGDTSELRNQDLGTALQEYAFVNIPLGISYSYQYRKYLFDVAVGTDLAWLAKVTGNTLDGFNILQTRPLKDVINPKYMSYNSRFSIFREVQKGVSLGLSAGYGYQANPLYDRTQYTVKNSAFDIQAVFRYDLKNAKR